MRATARTDRPRTAVHAFYARRDKPQLPTADDLAGMKKSADVAAFLSDKKK